METREPSQQPSRGGRPRAYARAVGRREDMEQVRGAADVAPTSGRVRPTAGLIPRRPAIRRARVVAAAVGLGSNLGDRRALIREALRRLAAEPGVRLRRVGPVVETPSVGGPPGAPDFLNTAALLGTRLPPAELLARLHEIEAALGRRRSFPDAPRTIDLDLLLYGHAVIDTPGLEVPHPRLHERGFALRPLAAIAPNARHPTLGRPLRALAPLAG